MNDVVKSIIKATHPSNIILLREVCDYVGKIAEFDDRVIRQFGKLLLRVSSDLMGDKSKEVCIRYDQLPIVTTPFIITFNFILSTLR
jgi:hypothetical protein